MFVILWEFEVKPGCEDRFQRAYSPHGTWAQLFRSDSQFRGTQLQRDPARSLYYFTIDLWDSELAYLQFLEVNQSAYAGLDHSTEALTLHERQILSFTLNFPSSAPI